MGIIIVFNQEYKLTPWVTLLNAVMDVTANAIVARLDVAVVATIMAHLQ